MTLIKSISGIRGTMGGNVGNNLTPVDIVKFASAYGTWLQRRTNKKDITVVIGRDARISGPIVSALASSSLRALGINIVDLGLSTTPTVEVMVTELKANGGIIFTASHNPKEWNALKLFNELGEFLDAKDGNEVLQIADKEEFIFADIDQIGGYVKNEEGINIHINKIMALPEVFEGVVREKTYKIVVDAVNSTGGIAVPALLERMGCDVIKLNCTPNGEFPHNPEPLRKHLDEICELVPKENADLGIVVDPDVDRLVFVDEKGNLFGEEYTIVAIADYILRNKKGPTVSNLSSSRALKDVTNALSCEYYSAAVGEVNVVQVMKEKEAIFGGEGNGGVIFPKLHYGRDALVGVALFLSYLAQQKVTVSQLRKRYPDYFMSKKKLTLTPEINVDHLLDRVKYEFRDEELTTIDGVKIDFKNNWVHLRKSNTEPIIRVYTEAPTQKEADQLADAMIEKINGFFK